MLENALGKSAAARLSVRIDQVDLAAGAGDVCRVDVPAASRPTWAKTSKADGVFYRRRNNSTDYFRDDEEQARDEYIADRWLGS